MCTDDFLMGTMTSPGFSTGSIPSGGSLSVQYTSGSSLDSFHADLNTNVPHIIPIVFGFKLQILTFGPPVAVVLTFACFYKFIFISFGFFFFFFFSFSVNIYLFIYFLLVDLHLCIIISYLFE